MTRSPFYRINIFLIATILSAALAFLTHFFVPTILENLILKVSPNNACKTKQKIDSEAF